MILRFYIKALFYALILKLLKFYASFKKPSIVLFVLLALSVSPVKAFAADDFNVTSFTFDTVAKTFTYTLDSNGWNGNVPDFNAYYMITHYFSSANSGNINPNTFLADQLGAICSGTPIECSGTYTTSYSNTAPSIGDPFMFTFWDINHDYRHSQSLTCCSSALPTATPTPEGPTPTSDYGGTIQSISINPTDQAKMNMAFSSIPNTAKAEVFAIFPKVMPYILLIVTLGIAFFVVKFLMKRAHDKHEDDLTREYENTY